MQQRWIMQSREAEYVKWADEDVDGRPRTSFGQGMQVLD